MLHDEPNGLDPRRFPVDEWRLVETEPATSDLGWSETVFAVGNGYLGMRANPEEGRESHSHGTFLNGFHETWPIRHAEQAYGFAHTGQTIVNAPDAKVIKLYVNDEPLLLAEADLVSYERALCFTTGRLTRDLVWRTPSGTHVRVSSSRMCSFEHRHLAVFTFEVELLDHPAPVVISSQLLNRQEGGDEYMVKSAALGEGGETKDDPRRARSFDQRVLLPRLQRVEDDRVILGYRAAHSGMTIACGVDHELHVGNGADVVTFASEDLSKTVITVDAEPGQSVRLVKYAAYHTSRGVPAPELADRCERTLVRARAAGLRGLEAGQREWLDRFWAAGDVCIEGAPQVQQAVRWNLFQIAQASARVDGMGVPAKGLTGQGYEGHYFWDMDVFMQPFLSYALPVVARNLLRFRHHMLDDARRRAKEVNQRGALFPWRTINGEEASAYYAAGTAQYHINADIIYALHRYLKATGDSEFRDHAGAELLVETARMWEDLGFHREADGRFHIHGVTGPDEYTTVVNDNLYTNAMARFNLALAARTIDELQRSDPDAYDRLVERTGLGPDETADWARAAEAMFLVYDHDLGIHPQDDSFLEKEQWDFEGTPPEQYPLLLNYHPLVIYRFQVLKQADVVLAMFLLGEHFSSEQKRRNFDYYDPITTGDSSLSPCAQSVIAAEIGEHELARRYFHLSLYMDLCNVHGNTVDGVHVACCGGVWMALVQGFAGMRDHHGLAFDPRLPPGWESMAFQLAWHGRRIDVRLGRDQIELDLVGDGEPVQVLVRDEVVDITPGATTTVPIATMASNGGIAG
ncbi:MAG: glycosyl hydrolase family 65 protein [Actinomycetota bacterium]